MFRLKREGNLKKLVNSYKFLTIPTNTESAIRVYEFIGKVPKQTRKLVRLPLYGFYGVIYDRKFLN